MCTVDLFVNSNRPMASARLRPGRDWLATRTVLLGCRDPMGGLFYQSSGPGVCQPASRKAMRCRADRAAGDPR